MIWLLRIKRRGCMKNLEETMRALLDGHTLCRDGMNDIRLDDGNLVHLHLKEDRVIGKATPSHLSADWKIKEPCVPVTINSSPVIGHIHAESMALYAHDAATHERPWELWERAPAGSNDCSWEAMQNHPSWGKSSWYRRKPKTIKIGEYDVPEPCRVAPANGTFCYSVAQLSAF